MAVTSLVLGSLGRPPDTVATGTSPQAVMLAIESGARRLDHAERDLFTLYDRSGAAEGVFAAADLGPAGAPNPAFLVSYRMLSYQEHFDGLEGRYWAGIILGPMTLVGYLLAIDAHADWTHSFEFEVRVFDVRGASMVRVQQEDGILQNVYDTSIAAPLLRRTYSGQMRTYTSAGGGPGGADLERFIDEQAAELAKTMFDLSAEDVMRAARRAASQPVPAAPAQPAISATSGGETVVVPTAATPVE